jgi:hypothetical protein
MNNLNLFTSLDEFGGPIQQSVLTIVKVENGVLTPLGTGFVITSDGLMMTAKHVVDEIENPTAANLYGLYIKSDNEGDEGGLWPIEHIWGNSQLDIVYMYLVPAYKKHERVRLKTLKLSLLPPPIGTPIWGVGYHGMTGRFIDTAGTTIPEISQNTGITIGEVVDIFETKRDNSFLTFPCFQTNCKFSHGMSGGPIFRSDTNDICGVICSGYEYPIDDGGYISYGSTIWPSLFIKAWISLDGEPVKPHTILGLAQRKVILTDETVNRVFISEGKIHLR